MNKTFLQFVQEASDAHDQAMAHKAKADKAMDKNDLESYHMHMSAHHESMGQWHESKGRQGNADKEYEKAEKHHDLGVKKATQKNEEVEQKKPALPAHLQKLIKDKQLDKKPMMSAKVKDVTPKGYGPNEEVELDESVVTHIVAKKDLQKHKDWMDSEGFDTKTKPLPKSHPKHSTHVGIVSKNSQESSYHEDGHASPIKEEVELDETNKPGWMLKQDLELAKKVKAKIDLAKKRQAAYGDKSAGKSVSEDLDEAASVSVTVQANAPAEKKYAVTEIHPRTSPRGRTKWKDVSFHSSAEEAKSAADAHAKKNNLHRMKSIANEEVELDEADWGSYSKRQFKSKEMEHELAHEVQPKRAASTDSLHAVHIDGKKWKTFSSKSHATNVANKIKNGKATVHKEEVELDEAGPFSYGAKPDRKGSVAYNAMMKRKEQEKNQKPIEPKDQMVGAAKVVKEAADKIKNKIKNRIVKIQSER